MKLLTAYLDNGDSINYYDINNIIKFNVIKDQLRPHLKETIETFPSVNQDVEEHLDIIANALKTKDKKFKLVTCLNDKTLVAYAAIFIVGESREDVCLIYSAWCLPGLAHLVIGKMLILLDAFAAVHLCKRMTFFTARNAKTMARLLKKFGFEHTRNVFEREVNIL